MTDRYESFPSVGPSDNQLPGISEGLQQQIAMMGGPSFMLGSIAAGNSLSLEFSDGTSAAFFARPYDNPRGYVFDVTATSVPEMPLGIITIHGATQRGMALQPGVLRRFSAVNWNMTWRHRLTERDGSREYFAELMAKGATYVGLDDKGYYMDRARWPLGRDTADLAQVRVKKTATDTWLAHFLE